MRRKRYYSQAKSPRQKKGRDIAIERLQKDTTKLWFGKYKGMAVKDIPGDYLAYVLTIEVDSSNWRMKALMAFIHDYIKGR